MADEGLFIEFVEKLKNQGDLAGLDNAESWYYHTMKLAEQLGSSSRAKLLRFALSMRLYSPKVHLHQQVCTLLLHIYINIKLLACVLLMRL